MKKITLTILAMILMVSFIPMAGQIAGLFFQSIS